MPPLSSARKAAVSSADWHALALDESGAELGKARLEFTRSMRSEQRLHSFDNCMIVSVAAGENQITPPQMVFQGKVELFLEGTDTSAVVSDARMLESNVSDARLNACIAKSFVGPTHIALVAGARHRLSFPVTLHRQTMAFYRNKYPPPAN